MTANISSSDELRGINIQIEEDQELIRRAQERLKTLYELRAWCESGRRLRVTKDVLLPEGCMGDGIIRPYYSVVHETLGAMTYQIEDDCVHVGWKQDRVSDSFHTAPTLGFENPQLAEDFLRGLGVPFNMLSLHRHRLCNAPYPRTLYSRVPGYTRIRFDTRHGIIESAISTPDTTII